MRIYIASPLGFSEAGRHFYHQVLIPAVAATGHEPVDPWALAPEEALQDALAMSAGEAKTRRLIELDDQIAAGNVATIDTCDMVLAVLDGTDVDSGTAAEIGYAFARGKRIVGYRGDFRRTGENDGVTVNLQVEYFIRGSGGRVIRQLSELAAALG